VASQEREEEDEVDPAIKLQQSSYMKGNTYNFYENNWGIAEVLTPEQD